MFKYFVKIRNKKIHYLTITKIERFIKGADSLISGVVIISGISPMAIVFASFVLGLIIGAAISGFPVLDLQKPLGLFKSGSENSSPHDRIKDYNVRVFDDRVVVYINDPYLARFADTHSMEPLLDARSTGIEIVPVSSDEIKVGDVISYQSGYSDDTVIHRVVDISKDSEGWFAITKGDNNQDNDPEKIRFGQVKRILVGLLY